MGYYSEPLRCQIPKGSIPWDMIAPHEQQAVRNHSQTLERLAERGGLSYSEAIAVLTDRPFISMPVMFAINQLADLVMAWEAGKSSAKPKI